VEIVLMPIADEILEQYAADPVFAPVSKHVPPPVDVTHHAIRKPGLTYTLRGGRS
jgi:hypothetical protein